MQRVRFRDTFAPGTKEVRNCHINIGTGSEISIADLARLVARKMGFGGRLYFNSDRPDGTPRKLTDVSRLHALGWSHKIDMETGVERLCADLLSE